MGLITANEILMGRDKEYPPTPQQMTNLGILLARLNKFRSAYARPMNVTSGYRPGKYNKAAGGAGKSAHLTLEACDFADPTGGLAAFCIQNLKLLEECGLWMESPTKTKGWVHLQTRPVPGKRVFLP